MRARHIFHFVGWLVHALALAIVLAPAGRGGRLMRGRGSVLGPGAVCWRGDGCVAPSGV
jgi:hypothetical protein